MMSWSSGIGRDSATGQHTALVEIKGVIADGQAANADYIIVVCAGRSRTRMLPPSFCASTVPVAVRQAVTSMTIHRCVACIPKRRCIAVVTDICASGGYYRGGGRRDLRRQASIVGSVGVLMDGFGFVGTMEKLGVERRLVTAGQSRASSIRSRR